MKREETTAFHGLCSTRHTTLLLRPMIPPSQGRTILGLARRPGLPRTILALRVTRLPREACSLDSVLGSPGPPQKRILRPCSQVCKAGPSAPSQPRLCSESNAGGEGLINRGTGSEFMISINNEPVSVAQVS